ncbi:acyl carrier protein [Kitasatospora sp. NPDC058397]|uniref:acyl carrier protein n=1 Tax=unclassified Kitasatospora TaxID=2633591 RepID=UPI00364B8941
MAPNSTELTTDRQEVIRRIVAEELDLETTELSGSALFIEDLEADSLSLIQIFSRIERELAVSIPQSQMTAMVSLDAIEEVVARYVDGGPSSA